MDKLRDGGSILLIGVLGLMLVGLIVLDQRPVEETNPLYKEGDRIQQEPIDREGTSSSLTDNAVKDGQQQKEVYMLQLVHQEDQRWINAKELADAVNGIYKYDEVNGVLELEIFNLPFTWVKDVPVVERNGLFLPYDWTPLFMEQDQQIYLPLEFLDKGLHGTVTVQQEAQTVTLEIPPDARETFTTWGQNSVELKQLSPDEIIDHLSFLSNPLPGAMISIRESHLPGARRAYRNGFHEGIDWYSGTSGTVIDLHTAVQSVADGKVVRIDTDYVEMSKDERDEYLAIAKQLPDTPTFILDKLRGRSVWVQYDHGVMVRYVHLSRVEDRLKVGQQVERGQVLGYVGNSGTSFAINGDLTGGLHLHADLLIYGELFWTYLESPSKVRRILEHIFRPNEEPE